MSSSDDSSLSRVLFDLADLVPGDTVDFFIQYWSRFLLFLDLLFIPVIEHLSGICLQEVVDLKA